MQIRFVPRAGFAGTDTGWITVSGVATWSASVTVSGGYYDVQGQELDSLGHEVTQFTPLPQIGIGDIFVITGQSNAAAFEGPGPTANDGVFQEHYFVQDNWQPGSDPLVDASINTDTQHRGSFWPKFGNLLVAHNGYPVGWVDVAVGGTAVTQWVPGASGGYYPRIQAAVQNFPVNGFRAVIWDQGEEDALAGTSQSTYTNDLESIIAQSRTDAGWSMPWIISDTATYINGGFPTGAAAIQAAQAAVIAGYTSVYAGANTDSDTTDRYDTTHFDSTGAGIMSGLWESAVITALGL